MHELIYLSQAMEWIKNRRLLSYFLLSLVIGHLFVASYTYSNILFLGNYPWSWIVFYYALFAIIVFLIMPLISQLGRWLLNAHSYRLFAVSLAFCATVYYFSLRTFPLSMMINSLLIIVVFHFYFALREHALVWAGDLLSFSKYKKILSVGFSLGAISSGLIIASMMHLQSLQAVTCYLLLLLVIATAVICLVRQYQKSTTADINVRKKSLTLKSIVSRPLVMLLLLFGFMLLSATYVLEFGLKALLVSNYNEIQIGYAISLIYASTNLLTLLFQLYIAERILRRLALATFVSLYAVVFMVCSVVLSLNETMLAFSACYILGFATKYSVYEPGGRLFYNVLPGKLRHLSVILQTGYLVPTAMLASSGVMYFFITVNNPIYYRVFLFICGFTSLFIMLAIRRAYNNELSKALRQNRYQSGYQESLNDCVSTNVVDIGLASGEVQQAMHSLSMIEKQRELLTIERVKKCLAMNDDIIKKKIFEILSKVEEAEFLDLVKNNLSDKDMDVIKWYGFFYLLPFVDDFAEMQSLINMDDETKNNIMKLGWDKIHLGSEENIDDLITGVVSHSNPEVRLCLLKLCECINLKGAPTIIENILKTTDVKSKLSALSLIPKYPKEALVENAISQISTPELSKVIIQNLASIDNLKISILHKYLTCYTHNLRQKRMVIYLSSHLENADAQNLFLSLTTQSDLLVRSNIARYYANHVFQYGLDTASKAVLKTKIDEEFVYYNKLIAIKKAFDNENDSRGLSIEVDFRINSAIWRSIHWIAAYIQQAEMMFLITHFNKLIRQDIRVKKAAVSLINRKLRLFPNFRQALICFINGKVIPETSSDEVREDLFDRDKLLNIVLNPKTEEDMKTSDELLLFRQFALFSELPLELVQVISEDFDKVSAAREEVLFHQGDTGDGFYLLAEGAVSLLRDDEEVSVLEKGSYFGELASIDEEPRMMTAVCKTDCVLYYIDRISFERLCDEVPEVTRAFMKQLLTYYREAMSSAT